MFTKTAQFALKEFNQPFGLIEAQLLPGHEVNRTQQPCNLDDWGGNGTVMPLYESGIRLQSSKCGKNKFHKFQNDNP